MPAARVTMIAGTPASAREGGPDFHQFEPPDELAAASRGPAASGVKRFAKRRCYLKAAIFGEPPSND